MNTLRIVFFGTPAFGLPCIQAILDAKHKLLAVYTQPDRPAGRGRKLQASPIKQWAAQHNIPIYQPEKLTAFPHEDIDLFVVAVYGLIIPELNLKGETTIEFTASQKGEFDWYCYTPCGAGHGKMRGKLIIE